MISSNRDIDAGNITTSGNVTIRTTGNSNIALFTSGGANITGNITASGWANITGNLTAGNANLGNTVTANIFVGSGASLTSIAGANVTGTVANASFSASAESANTANLATYATTANAVAGANVSGTVANATYSTSAGTVTTNAQPNITSVGTLSSLSVTGNITTTANISGQYILGDGTYMTGVLPGIQEYLFANAASSVSPYYQALDIASYTGTSNAVASTTITATTTPTLMQSFLTNVGFPNVPIIPVGKISIHFETQKSSGPQSYYAYAELWKRTVGGTETLLFTSDTTSPIDANTLVQQEVAVTVTTATVLNTTDRLLIKVYAVMNSGSASITVRWDDNTDSGFSLPVSAPSVQNFVPYINATANINLGSYGITSTGTLSATSLTGTLTTAAQPNITSVGILTSLGVSDTITAANITANTGVFTGNANGLSSLQAANVVGTVESSTNAAALLQNTSTSTTVYPMFTTSSANGNSQAVFNTSISANLANATITATRFVGALSGNVTTAAQPFITSVGSLSNLSVSGNIYAGNIYANTGTIIATSIEGTITTVEQVNITKVGTLSSLAVTGNITAGNVSLANGSAAVTYTPATTTGQALALSAANTQGGTGYADFLKVTNTSGGATNPNKTFRLSSTGAVEITNSSYTVTLMSLTDAGVMSVAGNLSAANLIGPLANGNSNVNIAAANGNVTVAAAGNTTLTVTGTGANVTGTANISGNVVVGNLNVSSGGAISINSKRAVNGPAFSAGANASTSISDGVQTKVNFQVEDFDTNNNYANSRFTPTVEGYYQLNATVRVDGSSGTGEMMILIWKNGAEHKRGWNSQGTQIASGWWAMSVSTVVYANGTTDYFEVAVQQGSGGSRNTTSGVNITWFNGSMIRGA